MDVHSNSSTLEEKVGCEFVCSPKQEHEKSTSRKNVIPSVIFTYVYIYSSQRHLSAMPHLLSLPQWQDVSFVQAAVCTGASAAVKYSRSIMSSSWRTMFSVYNNRTAPKFDV